MKMQKFDIFVKQKFEDKHAEEKNIVNIGTIVITPGSIAVLHIAYVN